MSPSEVKEVRKSLGKTQEQFAEMLDVHYRSVQSWERGQRKVSKSVAFHITSIFKKYKGYDMPSKFSTYLLNEDPELYNDFQRNAIETLQEELLDALTKLKGGSDEPEWVDLEDRIEQLISDCKQKNDTLREIKSLVTQKPKS